MKQRYLQAVLVMCLFTLGSCTRMIYIPHMPDKVNSPGFEEKNEFKADISASTWANTSVDVAYAPMNNFVVMASYRQQQYNKSSRAYEDGDIASSEKTKIEGYRFDAGAGYFKKFGHTGRFEAIGGFGAGKMNGNSYDEVYDPNTFNNYRFNSGVFRSFLQFGVGFETPVLSLMSGVKLTMQQYKDFQLTSNVSEAPVVVSEGPYTCQPYLDMRLGYRHVKFTTQVGFSYSSTSVLAGDKGQVVSGGMLPQPYASAGVVFHLAPRFSRYSAAQ